VERPLFKKLIKAGEIEVLEEGGQSVTGDAGGTPIRKSTQGHPPTRVVTRKGDR
jgi:hypothetical protein